MRQDQVENPIGCPRCGAHWDFKLDSIGRLIAVHAVTKCVPRPGGQTVECSICEKPIRLEADAGRKTVFWCSEQCHEALREIKRKRDAAAWRRCYARRKAA